MSRFDEIIKSIEDSTEELRKLAEFYNNLDLSFDASCDDADDDMQVRICDCGGQPLIHRYESGIYCVECDTCFSCTDGYGDPKEAVKAWNKRIWIRERRKEQENHE